MSPSGKPSDGAMDRRRRQQNGAAADGAAADGEAATSAAAENAAAAALSGDAASAGEEALGKNASGEDKIHKCLGRESKQVRVKVDQKICSC